MVKVPILYDLNRDKNNQWLWEQPYKFLENFNVWLYWWIVVKWGLYLGILEWDIENIQKFFDSEEFKWKAMSNEDAISFFSSAVSEYEKDWKIVTKEYQIENFTKQLK